jgi:hypothetical protein
VNAFLFSHATLSVYVLLTTSYVCQQYKDNLLLSFHDINVEINTNTALFPDTVVIVHVILLTVTEKALLPLLGKIGCVNAQQCYLVYTVLLYPDDFNRYFFFWIQLL